MVAGETAVGKSTLVDALLGLKRMSDSSRLVIPFLHNPIPSLI
jgi:AAA15 family ATPase/GTPase